MAYPSETYRRQLYTSTGPSRRRELTPAEIQSIQAMRQGLVDMIKLNEQLKSDSFKDYAAAAKAQAEASAKMLQSFASTAGAQADALNAQARVFETALGTYTAQTGKNAVFMGGANADAIKAVGASVSPDEINPLVGALIADDGGGDRRRVAQEAQIQFNRQFANSAQMQLARLSSPVEKTSTAASLAMMAESYYMPALQQAAQDGNEEAVAGLREGLAQAKASVLGTLTEEDRVVAVEQQMRAKNELAALDEERKRMMVGLPPAVVQRVQKSIDAANPFASPQAYVAALQATPDFGGLKEGIDDLKAQIEAASNPMTPGDPMDAAMQGFVRKFGEDRVRTWMESMSFDGKNGLQKAATYAARHPDQFGQFLDAYRTADPAVRSNPSEMRGLMQERGVRTGGGIGFRPFNPEDQLGQVTNMMAKEPEIKYLEDGRVIEVANGRATLLGDPEGGPVGGPVDLDDPAVRAALGEGEGMADPAIRPGQAAPAAAEPEGMDDPAIRPPAEGATAPPASAGTPTTGQARQAASDANARSVQQVFEESLRRQSFPDAPSQEEAPKPKPKPKPYGAGIVESTNQRIREEQERGEAAMGRWQEIARYLTGT